jgi:hypothetical protein
MDNKDLIDKMYRLHSPKHNSMLKSREKKMDRFTRSNISKKHILDVASFIVEHSNKNTVKFGMKKHKKARIRRAMYHKENERKEPDNFLTTSYKAVKDKTLKVVLLANVLEQKIVTQENKELLMSFIDLGFRAHEDHMHTANVLLNMLAYFMILRKDWQFFLFTPIGIAMMEETVNGDSKSVTAFLNILWQASLFGVSETDVLNWVPTLGIVLDKNWDKFVECVILTGIQFVVNKLTYEIITNPQRLKRGIYSFIAHLRN